MKFFYWAIVVIALVIAPINIWVHYATMTTLQNITIEGKERITSSANEESKYLIFTSAETFENVDSLLAFKFNSSDVYGSLKQGSLCELRVTGFRIPFLSTYRNILSAECS